MKIPIMDSALWTVLVCIALQTTLAFSNARSTSMNDLRPHRTHKRHINYRTSHSFDQYENIDLPPIRHSRYKELDELLRQHQDYRNKTTFTDEFYTNNVDSNDPDESSPVIKMSPDDDNEYEDSNDASSRSSGSATIPIAGSTQYEYENLYEPQETQDVKNFRRNIPVQESEDNPPPLSETSRRKNAEMGNRNATNQGFKKKYGRLPKQKEDVPMEPTDKEKALAHEERMDIEGACKVPTAIIHSVKDFYPDNLKTYKPTCVLLHRCTNFSGCCLANKKCMPLKQVNVTLYFTILVKEKNGQKTTIYKGLTFVNHTDCKCKSEEKKPVNDEPIKELSNGCICPAPFSSRTLVNGSCSCDCFDRDKKCIDFKDGITDFAGANKMCIDSGRCTKPTCTHGKYSPKTGKCPEKRKLSKRPPQNQMVRS